jgi:predicted RNA-binding Zn-ribbon protein involved in translation (DUF1610 family)
MRLIDADTLIRFIDVGHLRNPSELCFSELSVKELIEQQPTIEADPVKHGEWFLVSTTKHAYDIELEEKCSICGRYVYRYDTQPQDKYCPNCGAKMDKESENNGE